MEKFYKFERYLNTKIEDEFELSFAEIEKILGFSLANSAYNYRTPNPKLFIMLGE